MPDDITLTSLTAYSGYEYDEVCDCDATGADVFSVSLSEKYSQWSQEIRLTSPTGNRIDWIGGVYYQYSSLVFDDSLQIAPTSILGLIPASAALANTATPRHFSQDAHDLAVFGQATWNILDSLRGVFGLRLSYDTKTATRELAVTNLDGSPAAAAAILTYAAGFGIVEHSVSDTRGEFRPSPRIALEWDTTNDIMTYGSWTRGYKSGGFDARSNQSPSSGGSFEFEPEQSDAFEVGMKARFFDQVEVDLAGFYTLFADMQISTFDGSLGFNVSNAAKAHTRGFELDMRWQATNGLTFSGGLAYTDFEWKEFFGQCPFGTPPDTPNGNCDYTGKSNQYVSDVTGYLSAEYIREIWRDLEGRIGFDVFGRTSYLLTPNLNSSVKQDGYARLDMQVAVGDATRGWEVALVMKNLTDKKVVTFANDVPLAGSSFGAPGFAGLVDPPRTFTVQARIKF
jgi:outer membrane receptor protein involved in Fe transport